MNNVLNSENTGSSYGKVIKVEEKEKFNIEVSISPHNKRLRLVSYSGPSISEAVEKLNEIAGEYDFATKIFTKIKAEDKNYFLEKGYEQEGTITGYFNGTDALVMSRFLTAKRKKTRPSVYEKEVNILKTVKEMEKKAASHPLPDGYKFIIAVEKEHFADLAGLYKKVFETYPFPIFNPEYLEKTSRTNIIYGVIYNKRGQAVGAASAERELLYNNAEMTDFATLPSERGKGLASILLLELEEEARKRGVKYFYTIARSRSLGMNKVFKRAGYKFTGKLINNCNMCGELENMYIWCKV